MTAVDNDRPTNTQNKNQRSEQMQGLWDVMPFRLTPMFQQIGAIEMSVSIKKNSTWLNLQDWNVKLKCR
jgi:hypothetical protein